MTDLIDASHDYDQGADLMGPSARDLVVVEVDEATEFLLEVAVTEAAFAWHRSPEGTAESVLLSAVDALVEYRLSGSRGAAFRPYPPGGAAPRCTSGLVCRGGINVESGEALALFDADGLVS